MTLALRVCDLGVAFGDHTIIEGICLDVPARGPTVLVGRSGSGKTTLLRALNRLNEAFPHCRTSGQVEADLGHGLQPLYPEAVPEAVPKTAPETAPETASPRFVSLPATRPAPPPLSTIRSRIGMVFQTPNVLPLSVFRNMALPLEQVAGCPRDEVAPRVQAALLRVGLWDDVRNRLDMPAGRLSGGQQQRLCLARALALEPAILLLDEPTASLDAHATRTIEDLLRDLAAEYPLVLTSHSLGQARRLAVQLVVMERGAVRAVFGEGHTPSEHELVELL